MSDLKKLPQIVTAKSSCFAFYFFLPTIFCILVFFLLFYLLFYPPYLLFFFLSPLFLFFFPLLLKNFPICFEITPPPHKGGLYTTQLLFLCLAYSFSYHPLKFFLSFSLLICYLVYPRGIYFSEILIFSPTSYFTIVVDPYHFDLDPNLDLGKTDMDPT